MAVARVGVMVCFIYRRAVPAGIKPAVRPRVRSRDTPNVSASHRDAINGRLAHRHDFVNPFEVPAQSVEFMACFFTVDVVGKE